MEWYWWLLIVILTLIVIIGFYSSFVMLSFNILFRRPKINRTIYLKPLFGENFNRHVGEMNLTSKYYNEKEHEEVYTYSGVLKLFGRFYEKKDARKVVIYVHGYHSEGLHDIGYIGNLYEHMNVSLLIIDQRAMGQSEGSYTTFGALERFDIREWIFYINGRYEGKVDIYVHGVSMGAASSLLVTGLQGLPPSFKGVIADCAYSRTNGVILYAGERLVRIRPRLTYWAINLYARFFAGFDLGNVNVSRELKKNTAVPVLFIHGTSDHFVPYNMSVKNYKACAAPKTLVSIKNAEHCESYLLDRDKYIEEVKKFINE